MKGLVGGPLSVGGLGPWPLGPLKSGPVTETRFVPFLLWMNKYCHTLYLSPQPNALVNAAACYQ